jgi:hypothetical protein
MKGIIYYTDNRLADPIFSVVQKHIALSKLPITSVSLSPIAFGANYVLARNPNYVTMIMQIETALRLSKEKYVFFCEHDVLYPLSHFEFTPDKDTIFYYNAHVWRWKYQSQKAITYDRLISLSGLCVNREFALSHYQKRLQQILEKSKNQVIRGEPEWARKWGYEPGTKKIKRGGFSDDDFETFYSQDPIIDIRHGKTFSQSKVTLDSFIHKPDNWKEIEVDKIQGWNVKELF